MVYSTKKEILQTCLPRKHTYNILEDLKIHITLEENPYDIPLDKLFGMAARKNKKRAFLFVSKILGKHIPVIPQLSLLYGGALAARYLEVIEGIFCEKKKAIIEGIKGKRDCKAVYNDLGKKIFTLSEPAVFIGFAETATALGQGMFDYFSNGVGYIHTTREELLNLKPILSFEEEHSHATAHRFYAENSNLLKNENPIILIDDEITTGKTALNIIEDIEKKYPRKKYILVSLLDWRSEEDKDRFKRKEKELGISITPISLISGTIEVEGSSIEENRMENKQNNTDFKNSSIEYINLEAFFPNHLPFHSINTAKEINKNPYLRETGRFGIAAKDIGAIDHLARSVGDYLRKKRKGKNTLCLGNGEFMYLPMLIAAYMGEGIVYHSTTRSPIHPYNKIGYGIKNAFAFKNPEDSNIVNYLYNIPQGYYDEIYLFFERKVKVQKLEPLLNILRNLGTDHIFIVTCLGEKEVKA